MIFCKFQCSRWARMACFVVVCIGVAQTAIAADKASARTLRILTSRHEAVRLKSLVKFQRDNAAKFNQAGMLIEALESHVEMAADESQAIPDSTLVLIDLVASIHKPEALEAIKDLVANDRLEIAMASIDALGRHRRSEAIEAIEAQASRQEFLTLYAFRANLIESLGRMERPASYEALGRLQPRIDGTARQRVNELIADLTVRDFAGDKERFEKFLNRNSSSGIDAKRISFRAGDLSGGANDSLARVRFGETRAYYGIEITAKRILFVIDRSGSMRGNDRGMTRLDRAKRELIVAIESLPSDCEFSVVSFDATTWVWQDRLLPATEENKQDAARYINKLRYGSNTNTHGALLAALSYDDELEAVFLVTDGAPTTGILTAPQLILQDVVKRNRWRRLTINTIGISVNRMTEAFLNAIAVQTGGEFRVATR